MPTFEVSLPGTPERDIQAETFQLEMGIIYFTNREGKIVGIVHSTPGIMIKEKTDL